MIMTRLIALLSLVIIFSSCENSASRKNTLPGKTGNANEILLVAPDQVWKTSAGDVFKELMNKIQFGRSNFAIKYYLQMAQEKLP